MPAAMSFRFIERSLRLRTKLDGPGHGPPSYDDEEGAARGRGPPQREDKRPVYDSETIAAPASQAATKC